MNLIPFSKVESIGNDFVLIEADSLESHLFSDFAIQACRRRFAIGADGLLVVGQNGSNLEMRMFNPDGTEDFCGNGLRCAAHYAYAKDWVGDTFDILHLDKKVSCNIDSDGVITTMLGGASFDPERVPHCGDSDWFLRKFEVENRTLTTSALTTGSTHLVVEARGRPDDSMFMEIGPALEHHPIFPSRTSVIWSWETGPSEISIRIWERGVGETKGCGTGSSAAAVVWMRKHGLSGPLTVRNPGGVVTLEADGWDQPLSLSGSASIHFEGEFSFQPSS